jgi:hypothetical protein
LAFKTNELHQKRREKELHARKQTENLWIGRKSERKSISRENKGTETTARRMLTHKSNPRD